MFLVKSSHSLLVALIVLCALTALVPSSAGAETLFRYRAGINGVVSTEVWRLDTSKTTTVRVMHGATQVVRSNIPAGNEHASVWGGVLAGDVVQVFQGAAYPADPPITAPTETFTVPPITVAATVGSQVVSGTAEDGSTVRVRATHQCSEDNDSMEAVRTPGAFSATFGLPMQAGDWAIATATQPDGDMVVVRSRVAGDAGCLHVDAGSRHFVAFEQYPYRVSANGLDTDGIPTARLVLRRNGAVVAEKDDSSIDLTAAQKPLAGDIVELYRPKDAAAASMIWTIPVLGGVFDAAGDRAAVDAPAASLVEAEVCRADDCAASSWRTARNTAAGRSLFSFREASGWGDVLDIRPNDQAAGWWYSPDERYSVTFDLVPGDLMPPVGKLTLAKRINLRKKIRFRVRSDEAGTAVATLTTARMPAAAARKPVRLATANAVIKAGTTTVSLKLTKSGRKAFKRIAKNGKSYAATLTVTLTDAVGNISTLVKKSKLAVNK